MFVVGVGVGVGVGVAYIFQDRISVWSSLCSGTHSGKQAGLKVKRSACTW